MLKRCSGHICFISSVQGKFALPYRSAYSASKHALQAFADALRAEIFNHGIHVSCISPGLIKTSGNIGKSSRLGISQNVVALKILNCIIENSKELIISDFQTEVICLLRTVAPWLYFWLMEKRAKKLE